MAVREAKEERQLPSIFDARPGVKIWNEAAGRELLELALKCTRHNSSYRLRHQTKLTTLPGQKLFSYIYHAKVANASNGSSPFRQQYLA
eukprot:scaffold403574_cov15-Prasinocladus_malaysianus.AAC.1